MQTITTKRLILRLPKGTDLNDFHAYCKNPNVGPSAGWKPHSDMRESLNILSDLINSGAVWAIVDKLTGRMIGTIALIEDKKRDNPKVKMLGYALAESYWGQGIATEAARAVIDFGFNVQQLEMISVYHYTFNKRSKSVIAKCGFKYEGVLRKSFRQFDNSEFDEACYSLTAQEYFDSQKQQY